MERAVTKSGTLGCSCDHGNVGQRARSTLPSTHEKQFPHTLAPSEAMAVQAGVDDEMDEHERRCVVQ